MLFTNFHCTAASVRNEQLYTCGDHCTVHTNSCIRSMLSSKKLQLTRGTVLFAHMFSLQSVSEPSMCWCAVSYYLCYLFSIFITIHSVSFLPNHIRIDAVRNANFKLVLIVCFTGNNLLWELSAHEQQAAIIRPSK